VFDLVIHDTEDGMIQKTTKKKIEKQWRRCF